MTPELAALHRALSAVGGQNAMARKLRETFGMRVQQGHVYHWVNKSQKAPAEHVLAIEQISGVSRFDLRPDVFVPPAPLSPDTRPEAA